MDEAERALRQAIIDKCLWMNASALNQGTAGNISARYGDRLLITPSATPYDALTPEMLAAMPIDGEYGAWEGPLKPSTEWRFHLDIMRARSEIGAIVHTHSTYATVLAIARRTIPACHYMVAAFGGNDVPCADFATFGTAALSANVLKAMKGRNSCLMANHGMLATGPELDKALWRAVELEALAGQYYRALMLGDAVILSDAQMAEAHAQFVGYGLQDNARTEPQRKPQRRKSEQ